MTWAFMIWDFMWLKIDWNCGMESMPTHQFGIKCKKKKFMYDQLYWICWTWKRLADLIAESARGPGFTFSLFVAIVPPSCDLVYWLVGCLIELPGPVEVFNDVWIGFVVRRHLLGSGDGLREILMWTYSWHLWILNLMFLFIYCLCLNMIKSFTVSFLTVILMVLSM